VKIPPWSLSVATYNLLADAYIKPEHYPLVAPEDFLPENRHPKLDARVATLDTDVICAQEIDHATFRRLDDRLRPRGYRGRWAHRGGGKPDGCATFVRAPWTMKAFVVFDFDDGPRKPSNRIATFAAIAHGPHVAAIVNVHLEWHKPDAPEEQRHGLHQATQLLTRLAGQRAAVVCGDFNVRPDDEIVELFRKAGFIDPHPAAFATFNLGGSPRKIDFILHSSDLAATPSPTTAVRADTPLPSSTEPSDHVPLIATVAPRA